MTENFAVVPTDQVVVLKSRQRKQMKESAVRELADSILELGLIHAIVLDQQGNLVAGERRLRAVQMLEQSYSYSGFNVDPGEIPVVYTAHTDQETLFRIELEENLRRVNLTPVEEAQAIAALHRMREQANPRQTNKETAIEVAQIENREVTSHDETKVAQALLIDQFKNDPEVQAAAKQSMRKGAEVARKKLELSFLAALSQMEGSREGPTPERRNPNNVVICGDLLEILPQLEDKTYDIMLFDPPYGVNAESFGDATFSLGHQYDDSLAMAEKLITCCLQQGQRLLEENSHVLMFCDYSLLDKWTTLFKSLDYWVWPRPLIWAKGNRAHAPRPGFGPRYSYECILFAGRGNRGIQKTINDILPFSAVTDKIHAAEKPAALLSELLEFVAAPGDRILDPTVGSGSIFQAAQGRHLKITGIELNEKYAALAQERAEQ